LQSLIKYVKDLKFQDFTKFYFGEKTPNGKTSKFIDVTENVEPIFKALSEPMQQLYL